MLEILVSLINDNERLKAALFHTLEEECINRDIHLPINVVIDLTVDVLNYQDEECYRT